MRKHDVIIKDAKGPLRPISVKTATIMPIVDELIDNDATSIYIYTNCLFDAAIEVQRI